MSGRSFAITIRPKNGLSPQTEKDLLKFLKKQHHAFAVIEGCDEARHLHGQVWFESQKTKGDLNKSLERICERTIKDWSPAQKVVLRGGTKFAYNDDFVEGYCQKENDPCIIFNNPPSSTDEYYPSEEEQNKIKGDANAVDKKFHRMLTDFKESKYWINEHWTPTTYDCAVFLSDMMFDQKRYMVVSDDKKKRELCKALFHYCNGSICPQNFMSQKDYQNWKNKNPPEPGSTPDCPHSCSCCPYYTDD